MQIVKLPDSIYATAQLNGLSGGGNFDATGVAGKTFTDADLSQIMAANGLGSWKFNLHTHQLSLCPVTMKFLGVKAGVPITLTTAIRRLVNLNACHILKILKAACRNHSRAEEVIKVNVTNTVAWLKITGNVFYSNGIALDMMGTVADVSASKNEEMRKMDLMAFLNHELRTPLSTVKLYIQNARHVAKAANNHSLADRMMKADYQTVRMANMIDNFLTLSHLEVTRVIVHATRFNLSKVVEDLVSEMAFMYPDRLFKIELNKTVIIEADKDKIIQVLTNYLTNAVKYSPADGAINVSCKQICKQVKVAVTDKGTGIGAEDQKLLFNRYSRLHDQNTIRAKGFGLGLFLSKEIIEGHCGKVWVKSELGQGSTFGFTLPGL
jgi:signal transduction histidine kinase